MEFDWDGFDFSGLNVPDFNLNMPISHTSGRETSGYPSLMQELAAPLPDLLSPMPSFPDGSHLFASAPYMFGAQDPSVVVVVPSPSVKAAPILQRESVLPTPAQQVDTVLPVKPSAATADLPPPLPIDPGPTAADATPPVVQPDAGAPAPPPPSANTPLIPINVGANVNRKRSRIDGLDESVIVDTKRARKSQKRTEVEAITHSLPRGKENRCVVFAFAK